MGLLQGANWSDIGCPWITDRMEAFFYSLLAAPDGNLPDARARIANLVRNSSLFTKKRIGLLKTDNGCIAFKKENKAANYAD